MPKFQRLPVVSLSAEYLAMGYLMRRNILAYKAPPNNEGYDIVCIRPDPTQVTRQVRVQVKSRYATDSDRGFPVKEKSFGAFDYLIVAFLNLGYYLQMAKHHPTRDGERDPELFTLPVEFIRQHHRKEGSWEKVLTRGLDLQAYAGAKGIDQIATDLGIPYPEKDGGA